MPQEINKKNAEYKAGLFIIISLSLLIFGILWLRYFALQPSMTIIAKYNNPGPVTKGLPVYYQGVDVGKVSKVEFSDDFRHTMVYMEIYQKLALPANSAAKVESQGITGQKYMEIVYPEKPSSKMIADGSVINGIVTFNLSDFQDVISKLVKSGKVNRIINNLETSLIVQIKLSLETQKAVMNLSKFMAENHDNLHTIISQGSNASKNLNKVLNNVNDVVGNPQFKSDLATTIKQTGNLAKSFGEFSGNTEFRNSFSQTSYNITDITRNIDSITRNINDITGDKEVKDGLKTTFGLIHKSNSFFESFKSSNNQNVDVKTLVVDTLQNTNRAAKRFDCLNKGLSEMLNKRFILLRLLFGKPGVSLEECENLDKQCQVEPPPPQKANGQSK